jgi:SP family sugar:H+ symporter-like MFS transporter
MPEAQLAAQKLFGANGFDPEEYCTKLAIAFEEEKQTQSSTSWADLLRNPDRRRLLIAVGIQCLQQAQGSSYMNSYVVSFLQSNGITNVFPVIMGLYSLYYVAILTGHFLPDMYGRRIILMTTGAFCAACLIIVAIMTTVITVPTKTTANAAIALIFLWEISFGVQSPLIWIVTAESAPTRNREKVLSMATFWGFGVSLLITSVSPYLQNEGYGNLGSKIVSTPHQAKNVESADDKGFIWGAFSIVTVVWVFFIVPECKGFSLEQLDHLFTENVPTRAFSSYKFTDDVLSVAVKEGDEEAGGMDKDEKDLSSTYVQGLDQK